MHCNCGWWEHKIDLLSISVTIWSLLVGSVIKMSSMVIFRATLVERHRFDWGKLSAQKSAGFPAPFVCVQIRLNILLGKTINNSFFVDLRSLQSRVHDVRFVKSSLLQFGTINFIGFASLISWHGTNKKGIGVIWLGTHYFLFTGKIEV